MQQQRCIVYRFERLAAIGIPVATAYRVFRSSSIIMLTVMLAVACDASRDGVAAAEPQERAANTRTARKRPVRQAYEQYQVAAGTTLPIELRTRLSSNGSRRADLVEGRLLRAITADGVELVPAGATVMGTVSDAEPAAAKAPGRLAFSFHVIEHPQTQSRATIRAASRTFESPRPPKGAVYADVALEKGVDASVLLVAPLLVRLPVAD